MLLSYDSDMVKRRVNYIRIIPNFHYTAIIKNNQLFNFKKSYQTIIVIFLEICYIIF